MPFMRTILLGLFLLISLPLSAFQLEHKLDLKKAYPQADKIVANKKVPSLFDAFKEGEQIGYLIINTNYTESIGYSGKPIHMAIGVDKDGVIRGIQLLKHSEPIVLIGIPEPKLMKPFNKLIGYNVIKGFKEKTLEDNEIDIVSGATVTVIVMNDSIISSVIKAFRSLSVIDQEGQAAREARTLKASMPNETKTWQQLLDEGSIKNLHLTTAQVSQTFLDKGFAEAANRVKTLDPNETFIDLYMGMVSIPEIGGNLLGKGEYRNLKEKIVDGQQAIVVAANGLFSFRGSGFVRGGVFDRFQIEQGENTIRFRDQHYKRLRQIYADGAPEFVEIGVFYLPKPSNGKSKFDVGDEFVFNLLVSQAVGPREKRFFNAHLPYQTPDKFVDIVAPKPVVKQLQYVPEGGEAKSERNTANMKLVKSIWKGKHTQIIVLGILLAILTIIFFFQNQLTKSAKWTKIVRYSFLTFVLVWLGFINNAQLSVVNILTFFGSLINNFDWSFFLRDPLVFILWCSVAASLILWARGAYCGWLCPFGALQELTNHIARKFKIPQITLPWALQERLWALKYMLFLGLLGVS
jgi:NosR/NirI family nitrous oxide reductase transcriptional regulator